MPDIYSDEMIEVCGLGLFHIIVCRFTTHPAAMYDNWIHTYMHLYVLSTHSVHAPFIVCTQCTQYTMLHVCVYDVYIHMYVHMYVCVDVYVYVLCMCICRIRGY